MSSSQNIINDLLVGLGAPQATNAGGKGIGTGDGTGSDFAALLGMLSGIGINANGMQNAPTLNLQAAQTSLPSTLDVTGTNQFAAQLVSLLGGQANLLGMASNPAAISNPTADNTRLGIPMTAVGINTQKILQLLSVAQNGDASAAVNQLPEGKYKVVSASITDGKLDLSLVSKDDPKSEIHVSIPVELLQKSAAAETGLFQPLTQRSAVAQPVDQPTSSSNTQSLTELFGQLNVTDVSISKASLQTAQTGQAMTAISFSGNEASAAPLLTSIVPTAQLKAFVNVAPGPEGSSDSGAAEATDIMPTQNGKSTTSAVSFVQSDPLRPAAQPQAVAQSDAQPLFRTAAVRVNSKVLTQDSSLIEKLIGDTDKADNSLFKIDLNDSSLKGANLSRPLSSGTTKLDQPAVRITLPQNLSSLLDGHGRSINIKLEPDYLGPARLNLFMRGESLTAKLTVETQQAKAAVESSITQLTDQLAKAGIKVDYFDVSMRGGGAGQQNFQRPQDWFASNRPRVRDLDDDSSLDAVAKTETPTALRDLTYLHGRGVNLYA